MLEKTNKQTPQQITLKLIFAHKAFHTRSNVNRQALYFLTKVSFVLLGHAWVVIAARHEPFINPCTINTHDLYHKTEWLFVLHTYHIENEGNSFWTLSIFTWRDLLTFGLTTSRLKEHIPWNLQDTFEQRLTCGWERQSQWKEQRSPCLVLSLLF